ncbi:MAG: EamA family transporter [Patescibacteria group bacterium]
MDSWFFNSILAMAAFGGMQALLKVPAAKGYSKFVYSVLSFAVALILSFVFFRSDISFDVHTMLFGFAWGIANAAYVLLQMQILKRLDTSESFPITSLGSHVLVVIIGIFFFNDILSALQTAALIGTFLLIGFYNHTNKHITLSNGLIPTAAGIILLSTFIKFIQKSGSISSVTGDYIFWQLFFATIASVLILLLTKNKRLAERKVDGKLIIWSSLAGILFFAGTVAMVKALTTGPFSLVYTINTFYILVSSIVAWKLFGEKLTRQKVLFILLAIVVLVLIKVG